MLNVVSRARVLALLGLLAYAPLAAGQTMEIVAGQGRFVDIPGSAVAMQPGSMAVAADGYLYLNDINGKLMRLNTATGNVTALPATPGGLNHNVGWAYGIGIDFARASPHCRARCTTSHQRGRHIDECRTHGAVRSHGIRARWNDLCHSGWRQSRVCPPSVGSVRSHRRQ